MPMNQILIHKIETATVNWLCVKKYVHSNLWNKRKGYVNEGKCSHFFDI